MTPREEIQQILEREQRYADECTELAKGFGGRADILRRLLRHDDTVLAELVPRLKKAGAGIFPS